VAYAQLERGILRERVKAGMDRARKEGRKIGRPRVTDRRAFNQRFGAILERLSQGLVSRRKAAQELGIGYATLKRLLDDDARLGYAVQSRISQIYFDRYIEAVKKLQAIISTIPLETD
jgi:DNA invertase Pin-like site-specific DNA recombinase